MSIETKDNQAPTVCVGDKIRHLNGFTRPTVHIGRVIDVDSNHIVTLDNGMWCHRWQVVEIVAPEMIVGLA